MNRLYQSMVVVAVAGAGTLLVLKPWKTNVVTRPAHTTGYGFDDLAQESGLIFRTTFLADEQGEHFKVNLYDHGSGVAVADIDDDGDDDIYLLNQLGPNGLFRNDGKGHFTDITTMAGAGLADRISVAATFADVDGDGFPDLYVTTTRAGNAFFHNKGDGTFEDWTSKSGLQLFAHSEQPTFFDADGDGDLDLLVTNSAKWTLDRYDEATKHFFGRLNIFDLMDSPLEYNHFYRNLGNGTFSDETESAGMAGNGWGGDTAVFDCDDDGDLDVFVANMFGSSILFANDGQGHFKDVTKATLGRTSWGTVGAKAFDYDGDGRLDLFLVDMHSDMWMSHLTPPSEIPETKKYASPFGPMTVEQLANDPGSKKFRDTRPYESKDVVFGNTLLHNLGGGRYEEVSDRAGTETLWPWGIAAGDFDGDGTIDAFIPSGMGFPYEFWRSPLLMNNGNGTFTDRSVAAGIAIPRGGENLPIKIEGRNAARSSRAAAVGDFDGDGRLDLVVNNFNDVTFLYMNHFTSTNWLELDLSGTKSNRDAIGALVKLSVGGRTLLRQVDAAGGYLAQSSHTLHFGLGKAEKIDHAEIRWPSGIVQPIDHLDINRRTKISEPVR